MIDYIKEFIMNIMSKIITLQQYCSAMLSSRFNLGKKVRFRRFFLRAGNGRIDIGNNVFFNNNVSLNVLGHLTIGNDVLFGENIKLYDHDHAYDIEPFSIYKHKFTIEDICIGNNVWIGTGTIILKGTIIEDNVIIAAGSIISGYIPKNTKVIQKRHKYLYNLKF